MPYQIRQRLEGKEKPICVNRNDTVALALALMIEHDYSQLPVIKEQEGLEVSRGNDRL